MNIEKLSSYSRPELREFLLSDTSITPFQRKVYLALLDIPHGTTVSYGELSRKIGCRSAQAVGQALRRNPYAPYVPCHLVVAKDGTMRGYGGSTSPEALEKKRKLILHNHTTQALNQNTKPTHQWMVPLSGLFVLCDD